MLTIVPKWLKHQYYDETEGDVIVVMGYVDRYWFEVLRLSGGCFWQYCTVYDKGAYDVRLLANMSSYVECYSVVGLNPIVQLNSEPVNGYVIASMRASKFVSQDGYVYKVLASSGYTFSPFEVEGRRLELFPSVNISSCVLISLESTIRVLRKGKGVKGLLTENT